MEMEGLFERGGGTYLRGQTYLRGGGLFHLVKRITGNKKEINRRDTVPFFVFWTRATTV